MTARILGTSDSDLELAAGVLRDGGLVAFPTETVYGLGANALDADAVARVFEAKGRPHFDPLIVHVASVADADRVAQPMLSVSRTLVDAFWPGPLTLVLSKTPAVPSLVTSGLDTVAVRMPSHSVAQALITRAGVPIAAPSANAFGRLSPTRAGHVVADLADKVDVIVDGGATTWGLESTIVEVGVDGSLHILRHGAISREDIEARVDVEVTGVGQQTDVNAPGQLKQHYAPGTRLVRVTSEDDIPETGQKAAFLAFSGVKRSDAYLMHEVLSESGDLREAAANLFDALHRLDESAAEVIYAQIVPDEGVGRAINDRLQRAAATFS